MAYFRKWFLSGLCSALLTLPLVSTAEANFTIISPTPAPTAVSTPSPDIEVVSVETDDPEDVVSVTVPAITAPAISKQTPTVISLSVTDQSNASGASVIPVETLNPVPVYQPEVTLAPLAESETHYTLPIDFTAGMVPQSDGYVTDYEYEDPTIHVKIERGREQDCTFWICEVRIADASQLRTASADGFDSNMTMPGTAIARRVNAVVAIDGDISVTPAVVTLCVRAACISTEQPEAVMCCWLMRTAISILCAKQTATNAKIQSTARKSSMHSSLVRFS